MRGSTNDGKYLGADVLRGGAILLVIFYHTIGPRFGFFLQWNGYWRDLQPSPGRTIPLFYPVSFGWSGVALFFVLSGFCIHLSFLRSPNFSNLRFFWHRFWRIYPAYLVALIAFSCLEGLEIASRAGALQFLSHALLIHNLRSTSLFGIDPAFWSIATEVQLYLLFPLLLSIRQRFGIRGCLVVTGVASLAWRVAAVAWSGLPNHVITVPFSSPFMTWFDWTLGAYIAECAFQEKPAFSKHAVWLSALVPSFVFSTLFKPFTPFSFSLAAVASAVVLDLMVRVRFRRNSILSLLAFVGLISYSLYLWHQPLLGRFPAWFGRVLPGPVATLASAAAIGLLAWLSFRLIECGGTKLGKRLWDRTPVPPR